jgi:prepilin-type N-terminal cleavage/methylation domain-containing protein
MAGKGFKVEKTISINCTRWHMACCRRVGRIEIIFSMRLDLQQQRQLSDQKRLRVLPGRVTDRRRAGFTLAEVLIAVVIVALVFATILSGYMSGAKRAEWSGFALAAQSASVSSVEQARSAVWDIAMNKNQIASMALSGYTSNSTALGGYVITGYVTNILDIPWKGTNYLIATNFITITLFPENNAATPPVQLQMIQVDTVWPFTDWGNFATRYYTNSTCTYMAPDNRDPSTL